MCGIIGPLKNIFFLMARMEDLNVCGTNLDSTDFNSIHSESKPSSPKKFRESGQTASEWRMRNFFESVDSYQTYQNCNFPYTEDNPNPIIVIPDDCSLQGNGQTEENAITLSDSDSECLSLPDIEEPFDLYPDRGKCVSPSSFVVQRVDDDANANFSPLNSGFGHSLQDPQSFCFLSSETTDDDDADDVICISENSYDSEVTSGEEVFWVTLDDCKEALTEGTCKNLKNSSVSPQSGENGFLGDYRHDLIKDSNQCIHTNTENNEGYSLSNSILDSKKVDVDGLIPLNSFLRYILPYSLQPYTRNTNLGLEDLKEQPQLTVELIRAYLDEGKQFALCTADIFCLYLYVYRPAHSFLEEFLNWLQQRDIEFMLENNDLLELPYFKLYGLLNDLFYRYSEHASILWDAISETILTVSFEKNNIFLNFAFMLEIYLNVVEGDYFFRIEEDPKKCQVYQHLINDGSYSNIKKIIQWLNQVVTMLINQSFSLAEKVMCQLEKLLELCVVVSLQNGTLAKRIAKDLVGIYLRIPHLNLRQRFLSTIQSELIRFKFLEILLEKYCDGTSLGWNYMPKSIADVAKSFFCVTSLETNLVDVSLKSANNNISSSQCEELLMFIYFTIISYLLSDQGSFHKDLLSTSDSSQFFTVVDPNPNPKPVNNGYVPPPWGNQSTRLKDFPLYISKLNQHIRNLNVELSKESLLYLQMIDYLTDLMGEDLPLSVF